VYSQGVFVQEVLSKQTSNKALWVQNGFVILNRFNLWSLMMFCKKNVEAA